MKKGCPVCVPGPNGACPAHKGGPGRNKRKRMKKLSHGLNKGKNCQTKYSTANDCQPDPNSARPKRRDNPGRNKRKRSKKLNYEANNERIHQARIALERRLDLLERNLPKGARLNGVSQDDFLHYSTTVPGTASISGALQAFHIDDPDGGPKLDDEASDNGEDLRERNEEKSVKRDEESAQLDLHLTRAFCPTKIMTL